MANGYQEQTSNYQVLETRLKIKNNGDYDTALSIES